MATTHYRVGSKSGAGHPILFDRQYGSQEDANTARLVLTIPGHRLFIFKITTEEVQ